jgi:hypothetical protein
MFKKIFTEARNKGLKYKKELQKEYPEYKKLIDELWGDEDYFGDTNDYESMAYNIEIEINRRQAEKGDDV